ncbi:hypothetical protein D3C85_1382670 [compost metagenome]
MIFSSAMPSTEISVPSPVLVELNTRREPSLPLTMLALMPFSASEVLMESRTVCRVAPGPTFTVWVTPS